MVKFLPASVIKLILCACLDLVDDKKMESQNDNEYDTYEVDNARENLDGIWNGNETPDDDTQDDDDVQIDEFKSNEALSDAEIHNGRDVHAWNEPNSYSFGATFIFVIVLSFIGMLTISGGWAPLRNAVMVTLYRSRSNRMFWNKRGYQRLSQSLKLA